MSRPSEYTRKSIIKTAVALFAERGYDGTSIRAIVSKARVNQAAINYHFKSKEGLYFEVLKVAFVQGRLGGDEFDLRVGRALGSRTYADLAALTADLPAGLTRAQPRRRARKPAVKQSVVAVAGVSAAFGVGLGREILGHQPQFAVARRGKEQRVEQLGETVHSITWRNGSLEICINP